LDESYTPLAQMTVDLCHHLSHWLSKDLDWGA